jgi:hypothetical protein
MVDAMSGRVSQSCLESLRILAEIVQKPGNFPFVRKSKWGGKFFRQSRDVAKMFGQGLAMILVGIGFPIRQSCRVREESHALFLTVFPPELGCLITPGNKS